MHILQVTSGPVYPPKSGGQHRVHGLVTGRSKEDHIYRIVHALVPINDRANKIRIEEGYEEYRTKSYLQYAHCFVTSRLFNSPPIFASKVMSAVKTPKLDKLIRIADVIQVERPWQFPYVYRSKPANTPIVYSSHNYEPEMFQFLNHGYRNWIHQRIERLECDAVRKSDLTIVTSERDKRLYEGLADASGLFHVAPNATYRSDISYSQCPTNGLPFRDQATVVIFVGSSHTPNVTAVKQIIDIAESISLKRDDVEFAILGEVAEDFIDVPRNVHLIGFVDDLSPWYSRADIALNPMSTGAGTNTKMVEYFSKGIPVISTAFGARGIPAVNGVHYFESSVPNMESQIYELMSNPEEGGWVAGNAKSLVETKLNWKTISTDVINQIRKIENAKG